MNKFVLKVPNQALYTFAIEYAKKQGVPIYKGTYEDRETDFLEYPFLRYNREYLVGSKTLPSGDAVHGIEEFIDWCDNYTKNAIQLNDKYVAEIDREKKIVKVGCQEFSFEKVKELYELTIKE